MEYWWEGSTSTAISPTSASGIVGQHNKIGGITFGAAIVFRSHSAANYMHVLCEQLASEHAANMRAHCHKF